MNNKPNLNKIIADNLDKAKFQSKSNPRLPKNGWLDDYAYGGYISDSAKATQFGQYKTGGQGCPEGYINIDGECIEKDSYEYKQMLSQGLIGTMEGDRFWGNKATLQPVTVVSSRDKDTQAFYDKLRKGNLDKYNALVNLGLMYGSPHVSLKEKAGTFDFLDPNAFNTQEENKEGYYRAHYNPNEQRMYLSANEDREDLRNRYISELAHQKQMMDKGALDFNLRVLSGLGRSGANIVKNLESPVDAYSREYHTPGSLEYEAHEEIEPKLRDKYKDLLDKQLGESLYYESPGFFQAYKPKQTYKRGGELTPEELASLNKAKMKAKMALAAEWGNPSAKRMVSHVPPTYRFTGNEMINGENVVGFGKNQVRLPGRGTHFMSSMGEFAVPYIQQDNNGKMIFNPNASFRDREAIRFDNPQDAEYFAEHYKEVAPMMNSFKRGGGYFPEYHSYAPPRMDNGGNTCYDDKGNVIPCEQKRLQELGSDAYTAMAPFYETLYGAANKYADKKTGEVSPFNSTRATLKALVKHPGVIFMKRHRIPSELMSMDADVNPYHVQGYRTSLPLGEYKDWYPTDWAEPRKQRPDLGDWFNTMRSRMEDNRMRRKAKKNANKTACWGANCYEEENLDEAQYGRLTKYQIRGQVSQADSVRHLAGQMMDYEARKGSPTGTGLSDWGYHSSQLPYNKVPSTWHAPQTREQAVDLYMQEIATNPILGYFPTAMEKGEAGDFLYNTGRDPRVYMLDQYLRSKGQSGLPNRGSYNVDTKTPKWTPELQTSLDEVWNQYAPEITKLPVNQRRILLNKGRDFYYQNINQVNGKPNPAYEATWKPRIWESVNTYKQQGGDISIPDLNADKWLTKYQTKGEVSFSLPDPRDLQRQMTGSNESTSLGVKYYNIPKGVQVNKSAREKAWRTIRPDNYDNLANYARWVTNTQRSDFDEPRSEEGWRIYLGIPGENKYFSSSSTRPVVGDKPIKNYYRVDDELEQDIFNTYKDVLKPGESQLTNEAYIKSDWGDNENLTSEGFVKIHPNDDNLLFGRPMKSRARVLANFQVGRDKDEKGDYIYYRDVYDFPNWIQNKVKGVPFDIYNRVYYPKQKKGGMITDSRGQWAHPGKNTRIPGSDITMQGVPYPVLAKASNGMSTLMYPNREYSFPGASHVDEYPMTGWLNKYEDGGTQYTVKPGDTLSSIAQKNKTTLRRLIDANNIDNPNIIRANQNLIIPSSSASQYKNIYQDWNTIRDKQQAINASKGTDEYSPDEQIITSYYNEHPDDSYVVVDKKRARMNVYKGNKLQKTYEVGTGANPGDAQTVTRVVNGKTDWEGGNKSTGAGVYKISHIDPKSHEYFGLPAFNLTNDSGMEVATTIHGTPIARRSKFDNNNILDNRMSNGCVNGKCYDLEDLYKRVDVGSNVYILPEDAGNQFQIVDGKPVLRVDPKNRAKYNTYIDQKGNVRKGQGVNQSINTLQYKPIRGILDKQMFQENVYQTNDFNDEEEYKNTTLPFFNALAHNKKQIMKSAKIPSDVYNELAKMAFGIYGTESNFGDTHSALGNFGRAVGKALNPSGSSSPDYKSKATTYGADEDNRSVGLTQLRWSYLNEDEKNALKELGITSNKDFLDPTKAAIGTVAVLGIRYNQQLTSEEKKDIWKNLPTKWNKRANYGDRVKANSRYIKFQQLEPTLKRKPVSNVKVPYAAPQPTLNDYFTYNTINKYGGQTNNWLNKYK